MRQSDPHGPRAWTIRRAELVDVPAVARLLGVPHVPDVPLGNPLTGSSYPTIISATRLVLTHVGLERGEFWVAADADDHVLAAVVLLPAGDAGRESLQLALRLELGLLLPPTYPDGISEPHWLLLPVVPPGTEPMLEELLAAAMPAVDATGLPVLSLQQGPPARAITAAGFEPIVGTPSITLPIPVSA